jgi:glycosyltransferase involved in cell wall biosynthesis
MTKVLVVAGEIFSNCGVSDYARCLVDNFQNNDFEIVALSSKNWKLVSVFKLLREIWIQKPDLIHIQYPTAVYGSSISPQIVMFYAKIVRIPVIVTIHEYSQTHVLRKLASLLFFMSDRLLFTNEFEKDLYGSNLFFRRIMSSEVIPLGSSIPIAVEGPRNPTKVTLFGLIRPNKGIEEFLELADLSAQHGGKFQFLLIGNPQLGGEAYFDAIRVRVAAASNVDLLTGLSPDDVSEVLAGATFAYLHYPDGASDRRTSLISALGNGLVVLTTRGLHTSPGLSDVVHFVRNSSGAFSVLVKLFENTGLLESTRLKAQMYAGRFSWEGVTDRHIDLYRQLTEPKIRSDA